VDNRVREHRERAGLTQDQAARRLGVSRQTVISIERRRYQPSLVLAHKLTQLFGCDLEDLFIFEEGENL
jgi:putative transcriptional regulator